jgi:hypothetical protein
VIYFESKDHKHVVIFSPDDIAALREGDALITPDAFVITAFTPDANWTAEQIKEVFADTEGTLTPAKLDAILKEGITRPEVIDVVPVSKPTPAT